MSSPTDVVDVDEGRHDVQLEADHRGDGGVQDPHHDVDEGVRVGVEDLGLLDVRQWVGLAQGQARQLLVLSFLRASAHVLYGLINNTQLQPK